MAFPIIPRKRSGATGNPSSLTVGELAVNTATGELFLGGDTAVMLLNPPTSAGTTVTEHTGDGTTVAFTFTGYNGIADGGYLVSVGGIDQPPSKYSVSTTAGGTITFVEAPTAGELISIRAIVAGAGGSGTGIGGRAWSPTETYTEGDLVATSQSETWICIQNANTGNDPATSPTWWDKMPANAVTLQGSAVSTTAPTTAGQVLEWNGTAWAPAAGGAGTVTSITAGTGLTGGTITDSGTIAVSYGSTAGTAAQGNDARLSDERTPTAHKSTHAIDASDALTPADIGAVSNLYYITAGTGLSGGGDFRSAMSFGVRFGSTAGLVCQGNDTRLSNARTPTAHKSTHATGGTDALSPSDIGAAASGANTDITSVALTAGTVSTAPSGANDIATKAYADSIGSGINFHNAADYATTAALSGAYTYENGTSGVGATITANAVGTLTIDGYTLLSSDVGKRLLIKNETGAFSNNTTPSAAFNGVYTLTTAGTASVAYVLTRATDYDTSGSGVNEINQGDFMLVLSGSSNANSAWVQQTRTPITVGSTSLTFTQFAAAAAGVTSFVTTLSGLTPSGTPGTGVVSLGGTLGLSSGGTGATTQQAALNAIAGATTSAQFLRGNGTNVTMSAIQAGDVPTLNQSTTGTAANVTGTVAIANGGSGQTTKAAAFNALSPIATTGDLIIGNGTNSATNLAIGTSGQVLTSNGTTATWATSPSASTPYTVVADKTASSTLALTDAQTIYPVNSATGVNVTIPANASVAIPIGSVVNVLQKGVGRINFQAANGVTILSPSSQVSSAGQNNNNILSKIATNTWHIQGSLLGTDPNYSQISTLLHFDGTNGTQVFTDNSPTPLTFTGNNANPVLTTADFKFGTASVSFPGTTGSYISCATGAPFAFGTNDFTIEFWLNRSNVNAYIFGNVSSALATNYTAALGPAGAINFSSGNGTNSLAGATAVVSGTWTHVAITRAGSTFRMFINGVLDATATLNPNFSSTTPFAIGAVGTTVAATLNGKIDEFRVTNGFARYTSSFAVATAAFSNS